ncbi:MAG: ATP-binding protein [Flavobacteriaceae bacterium]|nr:ATP-binding protein [Flavobacteriaceae bacterium]
MNPNFKTLFSYLREVITYRLKKEYNLGNLVFPTLDVNKLTKNELTDFIKKKQLSINEIISLLLLLVPHISPNFLASIFLKVFPKGGEFIEFGGVKGKNHRGILPTGETILYVLFGVDLEKRIKGMDFLFQQSILFQQKIIYLESVPTGEPKMSGRLIIDQEYLELFISGRILKPQLSQEFPAKLIETELVWNDLILNKKTIHEIKEIETWLKHNDTLMHSWKMKGKIKPGYRVMFHGLPGTGKTLTASLLGKYINKDVYRIDLSMVVSKYIGETEKNLSNLFDKAINKDWILFFDEADSIFGKRTNVRDAHDKHANREVSYLLQRIEAHPSLVILASNFKNNIDTAFSRRFQSMIEFEMPKQAERLRLWKNNLPKNIPLEKSIFLEELSRKYTITGSNIVNVVQYACLETLANNDKEIKEAYILKGIKKEYLKEGKTFN